MHYKGVRRQKPVFTCVAGRRTDTLYHSRVCGPKFLKVSLYIHGSQECKVQMSTDLVKRSVYGSAVCREKKVTMLRFELLELFPRSFILHLEER